MKRLHTLLLLAVLMPLCVQAATEKLRILSFNIPYGNVNTETNTWQMRAEHLADYVNNQVQPDLIGMQEPVVAELRDLLSRMPGYAMVGWARDDGKEKGEYTPIIYKTERFYVEACGNYWLTDTPEKVSRIDGVAHNRIATWAVMQDKQTGARFIYTNTHLSYETPEAKFIQIGYLKKYMKEVQDKYGSALPHFLTGDFNMTRIETTTNGTNYNYVLNYQLVLKDMWTTARKKSNTGNNTDNGGIDYIYAKGASSTQAEWGNRVTSDGCTMSDHNPIWADLTWTTSNEDNARAAIREAWECIDSTYTVTLGSTRLYALTSVKSDGMETGNLLSAAFDGNTSTYCRSLASQPTNQPHYIQVALTKQATDCRFQYYRRNDNTGTNERWQDVMVTASEDGTNWDYITEFYDFGGAQAKAYTSPNIALHKDSYKYLRFSVMRTPGMHLAGSSPQFSCAEFQLLQDTPKADSERFTEQNVGEAVEALIQAIHTMEDVIASGTTTSTKVKALRTAIGNLRQARLNPTAILLPSASAQAAGDIYSLSGQRLASPQPGINIIGGRKVIR